ncbi:Sugar transporter ERD6-like 7 [Hibiscus syriacus]|uniref:Sugar transporter ERD6-like 7 n=1 Tax=Hibiscus syriacus TaxID=106335 RepID=A0A6A2Z1S5_HIBSY|nr:Sugar transporter ERD6-like 7 [Hibiscus syriacus]
MAIKEDVERGSHGVGEEVSIPLLREDNDMADKEDEYSDRMSTIASLWKVYFSTFVAVCGSFEFGSCAGYSSPTQAAIRNDLSLTLAELKLKLVFSLTQLAKRTAAGFCLGGWLAIYFAQGALVLDIGRLATGYGMGVFSYVVSSTYELLLINAYDLFRSIRCLIIGTVLKWRTLALTGLIPCAILLFGIFFIPESPRWLAKIGREKEFEAALQDLRGKDADISKEAADIRVVITGLNTTVIDRSGRKTLLLDHNLALNPVPILAVTGILIYISAFSAGIGAVPWVIMSEIFPINIKGVAGSLATLVNCFGAWAVSYTFNLLMSWSSYGTFILYAAINAVAILFVVTLVPETKGKTLEQIQAAINA